MFIPKPRWKRVSLKPLSQTQVFFPLKARWKRAFTHLVFELRESAL